MKTPILCVILISACISSYCQSIGPQVLNATGGSFKKGYYSIDWSVGELPLVDVLQPRDQAYIITNGFLQAHTDQTRLANNHNQFLPDEIRILPNPTKGRLEVNFMVRLTGTIRLSLYNAAGEALLNKDVPVYGYGKFERIDMSQYANGTYMLYISLNTSTRAESKQGIYKIVKIK